MPKYRIGQPVRHKTRPLAEATFQGYSCAGRIKVQYNQYAPYGVSIVTNIFNPSNIEPLEEGVDDHD